MKANLCVALVVSLLLAMSAFARQPATAPAGEEAAVLASFRAYNDAMMKLDDKVMVKFNHITADRERPMAEAMVAGDVAVAKLKNAVEAKLGAEAGERAGKAVGDVSNDDLVDAKVEVNADRARVVIGDSGGLRMIKVDGMWKFDMGAANATPEQINGIINTFSQRVKKSDALVEEINAGKFKTIEEVLTAIAEREL